MSEATSVAGRLHKPQFFDFWEETLREKFTPFLKDILKHQVALPLRSHPPAQFCRSRPHESIDIQIEDWLHKGVVSQVPKSSTHFSCSLFPIEKETGNPLAPVKTRTVYNGVPLNKFLKAPTFTLPRQEDILYLLCTANYACVLDVADAFFHVGIAENHRHLLSFFYRGKYYHFNVLPFGIAPSPYFWHVIFAPWVQFISAYIACHAYVDELLLADASEKFLQQAVVKVLIILLKAGFLFGRPKLVLQPREVVIYHGWLLDFKNKVVSLPPKKFKLLRSVFARLILAKRISLRNLASAIGLLKSTFLAIPLTAAKARPLQRLLNYGLKSNLDWDSLLTVTEPIRIVARWLLQILHNWNGRVYAPPSPPKTKLFTDASNLGWGYILRRTSGDALLASSWGAWTPQESRLHINILEIRALHIAIHLILAREQAPHETISPLHICMDSSVALSVLRKQGSTKSQILSRHAEELAETLEASKIQATSTWIPTDQMPADGLSRLTPAKESEDYKFLKFQEATSLLRVVCQWDAFATTQNKQTPIFVSDRPQVGAAHIDVFTLTQEQFNKLGTPWANAPFKQIPRWLFRLRRFQTPLCCMCFPLWPAKVWWRTLMEMVVSPIIVYGKQAPVELDHNAPVQILNETPLFAAPQQEKTPAPGRWKTCVALLSGNVAICKEYQRRLATEFSERVAQTTPQNLTQALSVPTGYGFAPTLIPHRQILRM